jgi:hypothetical protein
MNGQSSLPIDNNAAGLAKFRHKTGGQDALRVDVGIVYSKTARTVIALYLDGIPKPDWSLGNPGSLSR